MIRNKNIGSGFGGLTLVEFFNEFINMREIGGGGSLDIWPKARITHHLRLIY